MILVDSVVEAAKRLPPEQGGALLLGVTGYISRCLEAGTVDGIDPPFEDDAILGAIFAGTRFAVDKSLKKQINGSKGGDEKARRSRADRKQTRSESEAGERQTGGEALADCKQSDGEPVPKIKDKREKVKDTASGEASSPKPPYAEIVAYLNERCGTRYRHQADRTRRLIDARWRDGFREDDFRAVIDGRAEAWLGDGDMAQYLRPETLFGAKFEGYLNAKPRGKGARGGKSRYAGLGL